MKRAFMTSLACMLCLCVVSLQAQIRTPAPSPASKTVQTIGLTEVTVEYSRPGVKEREIFGGLVPYDQPWRLGANAATKITFDNDVVVGGEEVKKGSYAVLASPGKAMWTFMLYPYAGGNPGSYADSDVEPIKVKGEVADLGDVHVENMFITFDQLRNNGGVMVVAWDNISVGVPIEVHTDKAVMANIEETMAGPSMYDYHNASAYFLAEGKDLKKALKWSNKAIDMGYDRYWVHRNKALIQAKLGDKEAAIATAKRSMELAKEAGNMQMVEANEASIKKWMM